MCEVVKYGILYEGQKKMLNMKYVWIPRWCVLHRLVENGDLRLALFQNQHTFKQSYPQCLKENDFGRTSPSTKSVSGALTVISNLQNVKNCHQRSQENVLEFITAVGKKYYFAAEDEIILQGWIKLSMIALGKGDKTSLSVVKPMCETEDEKKEISPRKLSQPLPLFPHASTLKTDQALVFQVSVVDTLDSTKVNLKGMFNLHIGELGLSLVESKTGMLRYVWPYKFIRRYARTDTDFTFEAGRRCDSGSGYFSFTTSKGNEILQHVLKRQDTIFLNANRNSFSDVNDGVDRLTLTDSPVKKEFYAVPSKLNKKSVAKAKKPSKNSSYDCAGKEIDGENLNPTKSAEESLLASNYDYTQVYTTKGNIKHKLSNANGADNGDEDEPLYSLVHCGDVGGASVSKKHLPDDRPPLPENHPSGANVNDMPEYSYATAEGPGRKLLSKLHKNNKLRKS